MWLIRRMRESYIVKNHLVKCLSARNIETTELGKSFVNVHPLKTTSTVINSYYYWCMMPSNNVIL
jgi:hypothetical protein